MANLLKYNMAIHQLMFWRLVRWSRKKGRPLSGLEMMAAMGLPVTPQLASALGVNLQDTSMLKNNAKAYHKNHSSFFQAMYLHSVCSIDVLFAFPGILGWKWYGHPMRWLYSVGSIAGLFKPPYIS